MAVIIKADIITDVNDNLQTALSGTELDSAINKVLVDMSKRGLLVGTDSSQTLADGDLTLNYPTGFRHAIAITLTDADGDPRRPLRKLPGGHAEYRRLRHNDLATGFTEWYSEFDKKIYLWRPAGQAFTTLIEFRKDHAKDPDNIEFTTEFENLMFAGASFWHAMAKGRTSGIAIWGPMYQDELRWASLNRVVQPSVIGSG
ncbi:hypothetical protein LCGC14_1220660 [marine sediment metagenome]|uniref:Uncharacterized protein n=1 Tax=marine sediment metagenome TaxID=412755 RepID=A0A0F9NTN3_9ZZZZ